MVEGYSITHLYTSIAGLVIFSAIYFTARWLASRYLPKNAVAKNGNRVRYEESVIAERSVSFIATLFCGATGIYMLLEVDDILYGRSNILLPSACFIYPYFIMDVFSMYNSYTLSRDCNPNTSRSSKIISFSCNNLLMLIHHSIMIVLTIPFAEGSMRSYFGDWYVAFLFQMELSTPFLSLHYILDNVGLKDSLCQQINGLIFFVVFFVVRIASFPYMYWIYAHLYHENDFISAIREMRWYCHASMISFFIMQFLWFIAATKKLLRGATRIYRAKLQ